MILGLEKGIEIPERALDYPAFDLGKAHFKEDLAHLFYKAPVWMDLGPIKRFRSNIEPIGPELFPFPGYRS